MGLTPTWWLADFMTGDLIDTVPLQGVALASSLDHGRFSASLDLSQLGLSMAGARDLLAQLRYGRCTLVPILEGVSDGQGRPPTSRALGEWWISRVTGSHRSPIVELGGEEFGAYLGHLDVVEDFKGTLDPVVAARQMMDLAFTYSQDVVVDLQEWVSHTGATVEVDIGEATTDYLSAIRDLQEADGGPFEWMIETGLVLSGWSPQRVTRTLQVGQPEMALDRPDVTLEVTGPGRAPASLLDATWDWDEARSTTNVNGWGAGAGDDQLGPFHEGRTRATGEPGKSRTVVDRSALTEAQVRRRVRAALAQLTPEDRMFTADMPTDRYTPRVGEVYSWSCDASWTRIARTGRVKCDGWSWNSRDADMYQLDLVEVSS